MARRVLLLRARLPIHLVAQHHIDWLVLARQQVTVGYLDQLASSRAVNRPARISRLVVVYPRAVWLGLQLGVEEEAVAFVICVGLDGRLGVV